MIDLPCQYACSLLRTLVLIAFTQITAHAEAVDKSNPAKVYMHYMPWFSSPTSLGDRQWGYHWKMQNRDPNRILPNHQRDIASHFYPKIGPYDSSDSHVIENHLLLMKLSGVDGVLINWYGVAGSNGDNAILLKNSNAMVDRVGHFGMKLAVVLEDRFARNLTDVKQNVTYLRDNYFNKPEYIRLGAGRDPLLMLFGPIKTETEAAWSDVLSVVGEDVALMPLWYEGSDAGTNADGEYAWIYEDEDKDDHLQRQRDFLTIRSSQLKLTGAIAYPGFRDYYKEGGAGDIIAFEIPHDNGNTLRETLQLHKQNSSQVAFLQLATWNDFGEGSMFEPTVETGFDYLKQLQDYTGVPFGEAELQLVLDLFEARKMTNNPKFQSKLDRVSDAINQLDIKAARDLMDAVFTR